MHLHNRELAHLSSFGWSVSENPQSFCSVSPIRLPPCIYHEWIGLGDRDGAESVPGLRRRQQKPIAKFFIMHQAISRGDVLQSFDEMMAFQ